MARLRRPKAECRGSGVNDARRPYIKRRKAWDKAMKNLFTKLSEDGWIYVFFDGVFEGNGIYKLGKAKDFICRMQQWNHCCPNPDRIWLEAFWTPKAIRLESVLHIALEELCECRPRYVCKCGIIHVEKFGFRGAAPFSTYEERIRPVILAVIAWIWAQRL
ncbi:hypothetical protein BT96DRAFT_950673 [Gymnopus androsaceus JB14]|uniref:Bacteriophage T5 Orf172 DNA-binding domain-containing protein n=1 Tax=Gymnopus androsaceus JB14 TaxID=1447944 RepID=A0A6A4GFE8_9AGAR|nr:hypothetical protein BT96DRAFT_950673 [Gymnopus androsaceus JB14]